MSPTIAARASVATDRQTEGPSRRSQALAISDLVPRPSTTHARYRLAYLKTNAGAPLQPATGSPPRACRAGSVAPAAARAWRLKESRLCGALLLSRPG